MTFGTVPLMGGFYFIVAVIGLFSIGEIFLTFEEGLKMEGVKAKVPFQDIWEGLRDLFRFRRILLTGMGRGNPMIFFKPPIGLPLMVLALLLFFLPTTSM